MAIRAGGSISEGGSNNTARRTPSISAPRNYVYKHVYIYFLADRQPRAVGSLESGNFMVYGPPYFSELDSSLIHGSLDTRDD